MSPRATVRATAIAGLVALGACAPADRLDPVHDGPALPAELAGAGIASRGGADPLQTGHRLMAAGEHQLALRAFYEAAADGGMSADLLTSLGTANLELGRLGQAQSQLRRATQRDEGNITAWNNLGVVLMETGQYAEAREVFRLAFALDHGHSVDIRQNLIRALDLAAETGYPVDNNEDPVDLRREGRGEYVIVPAS